MKRLTYLLLVLTLAGCKGDYEQLFREGMRARRAGDYTKAEQKYRKALEINKTAEVYKELGNIYYLGEIDLEKAKEHYAKALEVDPKYLNALHNMGMINLKIFENNRDKKKKIKNNYKYLEQSKEWLEKALAIDDRFALSYMELGNYHYYKKEYKQGVKSLKRSIQENPNEPRAHLALGRIYYKGLKNNDEAFESLTASYRLSADIPETLKMLAQVSKKLKKKGDAKTYYLRYLALIKELNYPAGFIKKEQKNKKKFI